MLKVALYALTYFSIISLQVFADIPTLKSASVKDIIMANRAENNNTTDVVISTNGIEQKNTLKALAIGGKDGTKTEIKIKNDITENEDGSKTTIQKVLVNGKEQASNVIESAPKIIEKEAKIIKTENKEIQTETERNTQEEKGTFKQEVKGNDIYLTMDKKYEISKDTTIKAEQLKLKEGDKNIYINFTPEIKVNGSCGQCSNNGKKTKNIQTTNNGIQIKTITKTSTTKTRTTKYASAKKKKKKTKIQSMDQFLQNDEKEVQKVLASSKQKDNGGMASLDCIGGCQTDMYASSITNNRQQKQQVKVIRKDEPIYVINRIIQVDNDTNLTEENIEKLVKSGDAIVAVQQIGGTKVDQSRIGAFRTTDSLKSAYIANSIVNYRENDVVDKTYEAYGEIAFVDADEYD